MALLLMRLLEKYIWKKPEWAARLSFNAINVTFLYHLLNSQCCAPTNTLFPEAVPYLTGAQKNSRPEVEPNIIDLQFCRTRLGLRHQKNIYYFLNIWTKNKNYSFPNLNIYSNILNRMWRKKQISMSEWT